MTIACPFACYTIVSLVVLTSTKDIMGSMSAVVVDNREKKTELSVILEHPKLELLVSIARSTTKF